VKLSEIQKNFAPAARSSSECEIRPPLAACLISEIWAEIRGQKCLRISPS
jgi:hypothetical protein